MMMNQRTIAVMIASAGAVLALASLLKYVIGDENGFGPYQANGIIVGLLLLAGGAYRYWQLAKSDAATDDVTEPTLTSDG